MRYYMYQIVQLHRACSSLKCLILSFYKNVLSAPYLLKGWLISVPLPEQLLHLTYLDYN